MTTDVIVVKLWLPLAALLTGATRVDKKVLVDKTTDELDVVKVVVGEVVVNTEADENDDNDELEVVTSTEVEPDEELATEKLELNVELVTLVDVLVKTSVVELV